MEGEVTMGNAMDSVMGLPRTWPSPLTVKVRKLPLLRFFFFSLWATKTKRTRKNNSNDQKCKQSRNKVKADEKLTILKIKRKRNPSELSRTG